jgi:hypothetical protein
VTYDLTLAAARAMVSVNRRLTFCYLPGVGTHSSERGRTMWARVKGRTENVHVPSRVAAVGYSKSILYSRDINELGAGS